MLPNVRSPVIMPARAGRALPISRPFRRVIVFLWG